MKFNFSKKAVLLCFIYAAGIISFSLTAYIGLRMLPTVTQYSVPNNKGKKAAVSSVLESESSSFCKYRKISDITESGPFTVKSENDEIFVFFQSECLYRVNAKLSEFPDNDKQVISSGITAIDFPELCQIISYLES